ncbi:MAG: response regulator receiver protein [Desulfobacterales bacterium RIFOXYA12_FULL_46_15]|nr:MAG: response regulator receiver protein [Desulfobacula sp. GWF2_41_7]OGR27361.1 MAG: response regulator receiver protein [Desulfobacterales bacterium RIFOXYA12_FULL_46_15]
MSNITLDKKRILIVDDEPDVLDSLEELLNMCATVRAQNFEEANHLLETEKFDIAILDIMGVDGYQLLETATKKNVITVMLTAHALSPDNIKKSYLGGACSYIPKEEMINIEAFLIDVLTAKKEGKNPWTSWYNRLASFCEEKFGPEWDKDEKKFWEKMIYY